MTDAEPGAERARAVRDTSRCTSRRRVLRRARVLLAACLVLSFAGCEAAAPAVRTPPPLAANERAVVSSSGARIVVSLDSPELVPLADELVRWVERAVAAVEAYFGRFPLAEVRVSALARDGRRVVFGQAGADGVRVLVGKEVTRAALDRDWTLTHEMTHLALPSLAREHHWLEEGTATYVEPIARALAGQKSAEAVWAEYARDYAQGQPEAGDRGLDETPTWGRTYYGGALWCLVADVELRKRTQNRFGLRDALSAIVREGGNIREDWPIERVLAVGDRATGTDVLGELYRAHAHTPVTIDLAALWRELGVARERGRTVLQDDAPLAGIRRAITGVR